MNFIETCGNDGIRPSAVCFSSAILNPMASFGGLYVPEYLPDLDNAFLKKHLDTDYQTLARHILSAFELDVDQVVIDKDMALQPFGVLLSSLARQWTKFSPTIANTLTGESDTHDIDALRSVAREANTQIPERINALFDMPACQATVIDKQDIEQEVLAFL